MPGLLVTSELLDQIHQGVITLRVPLDGDVIQLGVRSAPQIGAIRVHRRCCALTVQRTDRRPLQVAIHREPDTTGSAALVFRRPVPLLLLHHCRNGNHHAWRLSLSADHVTDPQYLRQFVHTIGAFGSAKQAKFVPRSQREELPDGAQ